MLAFNAYVAQIKIINNKVRVTVLIFDIYNKQNVYRLVTHIACIYNMFTRYFGDGLLLNIGIVSIDGFAASNLKKQAESSSTDFFSKKRKAIRFSSILKEWRVDELMQSRIELRFIDYNITNDFMDGIKHANLVSHSRVFKEISL